MFAACRGSHRNTWTAFLLRADYTSRRCDERNAVPLYQLQSQAEAPSYRALRVIQPAHQSLQKPLNRAGVSSV